VLGWHPFRSSRCVRRISRTGLGVVPLQVLHLYIDHVVGVFLGATAERCSDENGSAPAGTSIASFAPHREKEIVLDHDCPPPDPWAEYAAGSLERDSRSSRAQPVTTRP
jgi:hypothetical protein